MSLVLICKSLAIFFKDILKAFNDFVKQVMFFDTLKCVYSESVFNTLYIEIKHKC